MGKRSRRAKNKAKANNGRSKETGWIVIMDTTTQGKQQLVQCEVRAESDGAARSNAFALCFTAMGKKQPYKYDVKAISELTPDNYLVSNSVLEYKPDMVLSQGDIGKGVRPNKDKPVPTPKKNALVLDVNARLRAAAKSAAKGNKPSVKAASSTHGAANTVSSSSWLYDDPFSTAVIEAIAGTDKCIEYKDNTRIGEQ